MSWDYKVTFEERPPLTAEQADVVRRVYEAKREIRLDGRETRGFVVHLSASRIEAIAPDGVESILGLPVKSDKALAYDEIILRLEVKA